MTVPWYWTRGAGRSRVWADHVQLGDHLEVARVPGVQRQSVSKSSGRNERVRDQQTMAEEVGLNQIEGGLGDCRIDGDDRDALKEPPYLDELARVPATHVQLHRAHGADANPGSCLLR